MKLTFAKLKEMENRGNVVSMASNVFFDSDGELREFMITDAEGNEHPKNGRIRHIIQQIRDHRDEVTELFGE